MSALRGMTWSHPRGVDPLVACCGRLGIDATWDARSLEDFEAFPLDELAARYDLMVIDHPHVGMAAASGCLLPFDQALAQSLHGTTVGRSHESYFWQGRQWALAIDAAARRLRSAGAGRAPPAPRERPASTSGSRRRGPTSRTPPSAWAEVVSLARQRRVIWPLAPVHALMSFFTRCAGKGIDLPGTRFIDDLAGAAGVLEELRELASLVPAECFAMNP
ncbi:MAG TPA: hypothetical protein PKB10_12865, partial [Tepidisphaeraceae bacterium]|nr:hypothetical protein [Tepidisphaeraceae bacterium]